MRVTPYGNEEVLGYGASAFALAIPLSVLVAPWAGAVPVAVWVLMLGFFRDPERTPEGAEEDLVSPADGRVTDVIDTEHPFMNGACRRVGIFLSVFDVHVNRSPAAGRVAHLLYRPGAFVDARSPEASRVNESHEMGIVTPSGSRLLVRQISGAIARRIVCAVATGRELARGERYGMIKFGSRAEVSLDPALYEIVVRPGDVVRGGRTVLARSRARAPEGGSSRRPEGATSA